MRFAFSHLDAGGRTDWHTGEISKRLAWITPDFTRDDERPEVLILGVSYFADFAFDQVKADHLAAQGVKIVVLDFLEFGWNVAQDHKLGTGDGQYFGAPRAEYLKLDRFLAEHAPAAYFKRELPIATSHPDLLPIDFVNFNDPAPVAVEKGDFLSRPIDAWFCGWHTSPSRTHFYGWCLEQNALAFYTWSGMPIVEKPVFRHHVCLHWGELNEHAGGKFFLMPVWHAERRPFKEMLELQSKAKIALSFNGCGRKCFRDYEAGITGLFARQENGLQWAFPWLDGVNCIMLPNRPGSTLIDPLASYQSLCAWLDRPDDLFGLYQASIANARQYHWQNYLNHLTKIIFSRL
jgi:hypothetical protein